LIAQWKLNRDQALTSTYSPDVVEAEDSCKTEYLNIMQIADVNARFCEMTHDAPRQKFRRPAAIEGCSLGDFRRLG
jgi:hypothetical protein